mgnify:CR=1 FL=1|tara:strand:+ start:880 stop:1164 length:285 start_codon:yes stop_codon:yes gene_type:complete
MSDSELNKADGCNTFFSFIIVFILLAGFFIFKAVTEPDTPLEVDHKTVQIRKDKIASHKTYNATYNAKIDSFHLENNSTIEKIMNNVINYYNSE